MLLNDHRRRDKTRNFYENGINTTIVSFQKHGFFLVDDIFGAEKFKYLNTEIKKKKKKKYEKIGKKNRKILRGKDALTLI